MALVKVASIQELKDGKRKVVSVGNEIIALFYVDGSIHAISNICAHEGGPLGEGEIEGKIVTCPWHGWQYDVTTGKSVTMPAGVRKFEVRIEGDDVFVEV